jgi:hypothetical protein
MKAIVYNKKALPDKLVYCDIEKPLIDRHFPLDKTAEAIRMLVEGRARLILKQLEYKAINKELTHEK